MLRSIFLGFWHQLATQKPPQMEPSWLENRYNLQHCFEGCFLMDVSSIVDRFLINVDSLKPWFWQTVHAKSLFLFSVCYVVEWILGLILVSFLLDLENKNRAKIIWKSVPSAIENKMQFCMGVDWLLDRFLDDFWSMLGGNLGPSWH